MKIDYKLMKKVCLADISDFESLGNVTQTPDGIYIHIKSNSKILAVAHLDTVLNSRKFKVKKRKDDVIVYNAQLDDRLGVYTILYLLPQLGINCDVLLTEGEESGRSTAKYFDKGDYNWIFSFDRRGDDVVLYDYRDREVNAWELALKSSKFRIGQGSFSDICFMEKLEIKAVNIGTGYIGEHFEQCRASMNMLTSQIKKFKDFYGKNADIKFPHSEKSYVDYHRHWDYGFTKYNPYYRSQSLECYLCIDGVGVNPIHGVYLCEDCFSSAEICQVCDDIFPNTDMMDGRCMDCNYYSQWESYYYR